MLGIEVLIAAFIVFISIRAKQYIPLILVVVQSVLMITFELTIGAHMEIEHSLFVDKFSIIMALIVGIIGSAICLCAIWRVMSEKTEKAFGEMCQEAKRPRQK